jgi:hypothetical protein
MSENKLFIVLIASFGWLGSSGCGGEARSARVPPAQIGSAASTVSEAQQIPRNAAHPRPLRRDTSHEQLLSTYNNPEEGISFRYPRNYSLEEGDLQERSFFLETQEDLDSEQPGATLLATVLIPEDGYPNTTFEHGSLQLVINEVVNETGCQGMISEELSRISPTTATGLGVAFHWSEQETETAGTRVLRRRYAGYSQGTCYEFLLTLAAEEWPDPESFTKPADMARIMKQLEKIVATAQVFVKYVPPAENSEQTAERL